MKRVLEGELGDVLPQFPGEIAGASLKPKIFKGVKKFGRKGSPAKSPGPH